MARGRTHRGGAAGGAPGLSLTLASCTATSKLNILFDPASGSRPASPKICDLGLATDQGDAEALPGREC